MTPVVFVRLRASPFSAGTERISPRASKTARAPVGESDPLRMRSPTFCKRGRTEAMSALIVTSTLRASPVLMSKRLIEPNCS